MQQLEAHKVSYRGHTYDSRLEADWAHTMSTLRIPYKPHPGKVKLPSGAGYEPDFLCPYSAFHTSWDYLLEVKGPHLERIEKPIEAAELNPNVIIGLESFNGWLTWIPEWQVLVQDENGRHFFCRLDVLAALKYDLTMPYYLTGSVLRDYPGTPTSMTIPMLSSRPWSVRLA